MKTYGKVRYNGGQWLIDAEPHVVIRLKRVFPKVSRKSHGTIKLKDTPETCRDLEWFAARYPLQIDRASLERLRGNAAAYREHISLVEELLSGRREPRSFDLAMPLRPSQLVAAEVVLVQGGLLLTDDVGVGKTGSGIGVIAAPEARPALVVTLTHLPKQWQRELGRFAPNLTTHILQSATPYDLRQRPGSRQRMIEGAPLPDVIFTNYHKLSGWAETLAPLVRTVIFDEAQELRRSKSQKAAAAKHIAGRCTYRLGLTATPIYNYGDEMFNVIEMVRPGALGSREEFLREWCTEVDDTRSFKIKDPVAFGTWARDAGIMLRRTRADVGRELEPCTRIPHHVDCDPDALNAVESAAAELARVILGQREAARGARFLAAGELDAMVRQATGIAKAPYVAEFVRILVENGEKVLVFGWHREFYSILMDRLHDLKPAMYTGSESAKQKDEAFARFTEGDAQVLLMSLRAGAGLDGLQKFCRTCVIGELDWSPGVHTQCIGRLHRDGQEHPVMAYFLIADHGSDPVIADVLGLKTSQAQGILNPGAPLVEQLQNDGDHIKRLAEAYLARRAGAVPEEATA